MKLRVLLVNMPVTLSISKNFEMMASVANDAAKGTVVLFPEGAVSGYNPDMQFLKDLKPPQYEATIESLARIAQSRGIEIWAGSAVLEGSFWMNSAIGLSSSGETFIYNKINLANAERGHFQSGNALPKFPLKGDPSQSVAVQLCRELRFPEQWGYLARQGVKAFYHLNNAIGYSPAYDVWRSHLISRAAENERFVFSVNNASEVQNSPTLAVDPNGQVLLEIRSAELVAEEVQVDISEASEVLLSQCRTDVLKIDLS